jgi:SpoVK/Ycf46/Vps4 family AAA+-type ATPase
MSNKQSIIIVLSEAAAKDPSDLALRLHLASLLLNEGQGQEALVHLAAVLNARPDDLEALSLAVRAADSIGQNERANSYRRILQALNPPLAKAPGSEVQHPQPDDDLIFEYDDSGAREDDPLEEDDLVAISADAGAVDSVLDASDEIWDFEEPRLRLADVAGMDQVKDRLRLSFLGPLQKPELLRHYGKSLRGGLLLYGPPGCGKTFIARATAGELGARFLSVGLSDVLDMWLGNSEKNLHEIFERARRKAPCVLFLDELDALGRKRSLVRHSAISGVVNQLLAEMDSVGNDNEGVFILAATNHPWDVDTALRRPGRLDRMLLVLPPDEAAREAILRFHLRERPAEGVDLRSIARQTDGFSGADLAHLCESAAELAIEHSLRTGTLRSIANEDFKKAVKGLRPSTRAWFDTARNFALFANEGGLYDDLVDYLKRQKLL